MALAPLALALALAAQPATAEPSPEVRAEVRALLGAIHDPVSPDTFRALGPGTEEALLDFARDGRLPPSRRARALEALAGLGGPRAEAVHRELADETSAPRAVRRSAVRGLGQLAGAARAWGALTAYLERDRDPTVRAAAAEALARAAPEEGCEQVRAQARAEAAPARFQRALSLCDARGQAEPPGR
jgi:HEAT repeat protein